MYVLMQVFSRTTNSVIRLPNHGLISPQAGEIWYASSVLSGLLLFGLAVFFFLGSVNGNRRILQRGRWSVVCGFVFTALRSPMCSTEGTVNLVYLSTNNLSPF